MELKIDNEVKSELKALYLYIKKDSPQNAENVRNKIVDSFKDLVKNPEMHPLDKYRTDNDGHYRAYEMYKYRISYYENDIEIRILRIRHTKMNPLMY